MSNPSPRILSNEPPLPKWDISWHTKRCCKVRGFLMHNAKAGSITWRRRPYVAHPPWSHCQRWIGKPWRLWLPESWTWRWDWGIWAICPAMESLSAVIETLVGKDAMNIYESGKVRTVESKESFIWTKKHVRSQKRTVNQKYLNHRSYNFIKSMLWYSKKRIPSRELTYPPKMAFWRWFSFSQGGIC